MRRAALCAAGFLALAAPAHAPAALPRHGVLVPGRSLGGVRLGETAARVAAELGAHGVCRGCARTTWYFTYRPFDEHGLGIELTRGRVSAVYTLWRPAGWHGPHGIALGGYDAQVTAQAGPLVPVACAGYRALVSDTKGGDTAYYLVDGRLWAFGLFRPGASPCR
jgi:hypothetical protein